MTIVRKIREIGRIPAAWVIRLVCYYALRLFGIRRENWENKLRFYLHLIECNGRIIKDNASYLTCEYTILGRALILHLRNCPSSDPRVVEQIFVNQQYRDVAELLYKRITKCVMVDAGANIGLASVYFKMFFGDLEVVAIEPDEGNYRLMKLNFESNHIPTSKCLYAALWKDSSPLATRSDFRDGKSWSIKVEESDKGGRVAGVTLADVLERFSLKHVSLLKMDIEGSEKHVFSDADSVRSVLRDVECLAIEIHDEVCDRKAIEQQIAEAYGSVIRNGELTVGIRPLIPHQNSIGGS